MVDYPFADYKILLIEDNPGDVVLIRDYLKSISPNVDLEVCTTFQETERMLKNKDPKIFDSILLDLKLPDKEGEDLIKNVLKRVNTVPVIILTGYSDMQFSIKSLSLGVSDYVVKDELSANGIWKSIRFSIERNQSSKKLQESEQKYRYLFENNPTPILIWNLDSRMIVDSNHAAEKKYGYSKKQFMKLKIDQIQKNSLHDSIPGDGEKFIEEDALEINDNVFNQVKKNGDVFFAEIKGHFIKYRDERSVLLLINDVTEKMEMQERLLESTLRAEETERNRIAKELHDGIVQKLVACGMFAQTISKKIEGDEIVSKEVDRLYDLLINTTIQTRDISHNLKSAEFEHTTLAELLDQLVRQVSQSGSISFTFNNHLDYQTDYESYLKTDVYRIVQELCTNIIKHSNASSVIITAEEVNDTLYISIKDDGNGFVFTSTAKKGFGRKNIESRMRRLGGQLEYSIPGNSGLQTDLEIPVIINQAKKAASSISPINKKSVRNIR